MTMPHQHHHDQQQVLEPEIRYIPMPADERRGPGVVGGFLAGLAAGLLMFAVKLLLVAAFFVALAVGCTAVANHALDHLPDTTTTTTAP